MAQSHFNDNDRTFIAEADLSAKQFYVVRGGTGTGLDLPCLLGNATTLPVGILQNDPALGEAALVRKDGTSKVVLGGLVSRWDKLAVDANGCAVKATGSSPYTIGIALADGVAGDIIEGDIHIETVVDSYLVGTLSELTTDANGNLVEALNEVDAHADAAAATANAAVKSADLVASAVTISAAGGTGTLALTGFGDSYVATARLVSGPAGTAAVELTKSSASLGIAVVNGSGEVVDCSETAAVVDVIAVNTASA